MRLSVIEGRRRNPKLLQAENRLKKLIKHGATFRIEGDVLIRMTSLGLRLPQLKTMLKRRCRVRGIEPGAESQPEVLLVNGVITEELEDGNYTIKELSLKVAIEVPTEPGRVALIDIGQLKEL
jgi:hypothetical protein